MKKLNRREFIGQGAAGLGAMLVLSQLPLGTMANGIAAYKHPVGFQTYPIRDMVAKDFPGTMKMMAGLGYQLVEMCYPVGYADAGFAPLVSIKPADLRRMIYDSGLYCPSCHFGMGDLTNNLDKCIEYAQGLGLSQMVCPGLDVREATVSAYKEAADKYNKIAEKIKAAGMITGLHNENREFSMVEGQLAYDVIMSELDGKLVKMQFQTAVINLGYSAVTYFNKYPGRFISAHLSDWTADKKQVPIGQGIIDWKEFFAAARPAGIKNFFVEMKMENYKDSATYIHGLLG
jgi:sugar phosphate isomerase/epimerase